MQSEKNDFGPGIRYEVGKAGKVSEKHHLAIGFSKQVVVKKGNELQIPGEAKVYETYECAGTESIHLFVREKKNRKNVLWYHFIYAGYDMESNCLESDFEGMQAE